MQKNDVKKIVRQYGKALKAANFPISAIYLFGSQAKGKQNLWSDIDVAIISKKLSKNWDKNNSFLWKTRLGIDSRLEPHGFTPSDFADNANPLAYEIRHTGIRVL